MRFPHSYTCMFRKILIANRGEIALRVVRACREMGIRSVVAHSEADRDSLPVQMADPGYGFLSENTSFAEICADVNVTFIGPSAPVMAIMGDKVSAREAMRRAGLPMLPGTPVLRTLAEAQKAAEEIGYPLMLKAVAGGGGRGIRLVRRPDELERVFTLAQNEVREAFRDDGIYFERYLERARHVEIQVLVDNYGHGVYLGERNCSCQRRNQKVLEESPSPLLPREVRDGIGKKAVDAVVEVGYRNAGTLEFLVDEQDRFYFMEMNTRLQVEHPVTEMVTGLDLVKEQIRIAYGQPLRLRQQDIHFRGHAIECRITAEDADNDFRPQTGRIEQYLPPGGPGGVGRYSRRGYRANATRPRRVHYRRRPNDDSISSTPAPSSNFRERRSLYPFPTGRSGLVRHLRYVDDDEQMYRIRRITGCYQDSQEVILCRV